jgi:hypothetical protein
VSVELLLREAVGWLSVLVSMAGLAVCALQFGRVRWAGVLLAGFALQALVSAFYRALTLLALGAGGRGLGAALSLVSLLGVLGDVAVVVGVAGLLSELRRAASR